MIFTETKPLSNRDKTILKKYFEDVLYDDVKFVFRKILGFDEKVVYVEGVVDFLHEPITYSFSAGARMGHAPNSFVDVRNVTTGEIIYTARNFLLDSQGLRFHFWPRIFCTADKRAYARFKDLKFAQDVTAHRKTRAAPLRPDAETCVLDIDLHFNDTKENRIKKAVDIAARFNTYIKQRFKTNPLLIEISKTGSGIHIWLRCDQSVTYGAGNKLRAELLGQLSEDEKNQGVRMDFYHKNRKFIRLPASDKYQIVEFRNRNPTSLRSVDITEWLPKIRANYALIRAIHRDDFGEVDDDFDLKDIQLETRAHYVVGGNPSVTTKDLSYGAGERCAKMPAIVFNALAQNMSEADFVNYALSLNHGSKDYSRWSTDKIAKDLADWYDWGKRNFKSTTRSCWMEPMEPEGFVSNVHQLDEGTKKEIERIARKLAHRPDIQKLFGKNYNKENRITYFTHFLLEIIGKSIFTVLRSRDVQGYVEKHIKSMMLRGVQIPIKWQDAFSKHYGLSRNLGRKLFNWFYENLVNPLRLKSGRTYLNLNGLKMCRRFEFINASFHKFFAERSFAILKPIIYHYFTHIWAYYAVGDTFGDSRRMRYRSCVPTSIFTPIVKKIVHTIFNPAYLVYEGCEPPLQLNGS